MKKILIISALLTSTICQSQDSSKLTAKQVYEDVKVGFTKLVSSLEGPAKATYTSYVKHYKISGISSLISWGSCFLFSAVFAIIAFFIGKWEDGEPSNKWAVGQVIFSGILVVSTVGLFSSMGTMLSQIYNPEYHAIQEIIKSF